MTGYVHHSVAHDGSCQYSERRNHEDDFELRCSGTDCRVHKVYGIVCHADRQVEYGQQEQEAYDKEIDCFHLLL